MAELVYAHDLKSCLERDVGPIPTPGTEQRFAVKNIGCRTNIVVGESLLLWEKSVTFYPVFFKKIRKNIAPIAQSVEQSPLKRRVVGSNPTGRTHKKKSGLLRIFSYGCEPERCLTFRQTARRGRKNFERRRKIICDHLGASPVRGLPLESKGSPRTKPCYNNARMKYVAEIIAFISGAVVMTLELDGSRIIAPYLGTSSIIWTSLIGIILGCLSLGYWQGGKIADEGANFEKLAWIFFSAGMFVLISAGLKDLILKLVSALTPNLAIASILATLALFGPATIALGMVTPYLAKLSLKNLDASGKTVGNLYAFSTLGSIVGTFLGGLVLISFIGSGKILILLSATLMFLSALCFKKHGLSGKALLIVIFGVAIIFLQSPSGIEGKTLIADIDTTYSRIWIYDGTDYATGKPVRYLTNDILGTQSGIFLDDPDTLLFGYTRMFDFAPENLPNIGNALMIGAGAYSYPTHFVRKYPKASIDVVEIDPKLLELAKKYFSFKETPAIKIHHEDGRVFLNNLKETYDVILVDAFLANATIPFQLTTKEVAQKMHDSLKDSGIIMINMIGSIEKNGDSFVQAEYRTYKQVFSHIYLFKVYDSIPDEKIQNMMLVGFKTSDKAPLEKLTDKAKKILAGRTPLSVSSGGLILTDDFAPVERYNAIMLR